MTSSKYHLSVTLVTKCVWAACPSGPGPHNTGKPELRQECSQCLTMNSVCLEYSRPAFFAAAREMSESQGVMLLSSATTEKATEAGIRVAMTRKTRFLTVIH